MKYISFYIYKKIDLSLDKPIQLTLNLYHEKHYANVDILYDIYKCINAKMVLFNINCGCLWWILGLFVAFGLILVKFVVNLTLRQPFFLVLY